MKKLSNMVGTIESYVEALHKKTKRLGKENNKLRKVIDEICEHFNEMPERWLK